MIVISLLVLAIGVLLWVAGSVFTIRHEVPKGDPWEPWCLLPGFVVALVGFLMLVWSVHWVPGIIVTCLLLIGLYNMCK